jgi:hypothetical protein
MRIQNQSFDIKMLEGYNTIPTIPTYTKEIKIDETEKYNINYNQNKTQIIKIIFSKDPY